MVGSSSVITGDHWRQSLDLSLAEKDELHILQVALHKLSQDHAHDGIKEPGFMPVWRMPTTKGKWMEGFLRVGPRITSGHLFNHGYLFFPFRL